MSIITADRVVNKNLFAKSNINGYAGNLKDVNYTFKPGQLIGNVYGWIVNPDKDLYWMVYVRPGDFEKQKATFIKHSATNLSLPALPDILEQIQQERENEKKDRVGIVGFYIEKYAPYIVGAIVVSLVLPSLVKSKKVSGMNNNTKGLLVLGAVAAVYFATKKKRKGSVIVDPLDKGEFIPDQIRVNNLPGSGTISQVPGSGRIMSVGIFPVQYSGDQVNGRADMGKIKLR